MIDEGPRYNRSAEAAAHIVNVILSRDDPPATRYAKILYCILEAMDEAEREMARMRIIVSQN